MEHHVGSSEGVRKKAKQRLEAVLRKPGKSAEEAAREADTIVNLAYLVGDPVRDLFAAAQANAAQGGQPIPADAEGLRSTRPSGHQRTPSPAETIRPMVEVSRPKSSHKSFFRFGRGRDKTASNQSASPGIKGVTPAFEQHFGQTKRKERSDASPPASSAGSSKASSMTASFCSSQKPNRAVEVVQYTCIFCDAELSSKGVCKRHLIDQHVTPQVYECECCHAHFDAKAEAKKHSSQCGDGDYSYFTTKLAKKVYACEFTGSYFISLQRYIDFLLRECERKPERSKCNLNLKLEAILRSATLLPLCDDISKRIYHNTEAWKTLQWTEPYLLNALGEMEHATFHTDGTMESTKWTGRTPRLRNTEQYLIRLFQDGDLRGQDLEEMLRIKQEPSANYMVPKSMSRPTLSMMHMQNTLDPQYDSTSPASLPRSQSRHAMCSPDAIEQASSATTPRSGGGSGDQLTPELKGKRHLSDQSRAYVPARTPPGPPEPLERYQYPMEMAPQIPPLPTFMTPGSSTMSLPVRKHEDTGYAPNYSAPMPYMNQVYQVGNSSHSLASDGASETSTLAQSYRDPSISDRIGMDYPLYMQQYGYQAQHGYGYPGAGYVLPDDASIAASSVATGNTVVDYSTEIPKTDSYTDVQGYQLQGPPQTFYFDGDDQRHVHHMG